MVLKFPFLVFGTWFMGGSFEKEKNYDESNDIKAIKQTMGLGGYRFDTAEMYAQGYSEEILGKALKGYDRSKVFVTSKVSAANLSLALKGVINYCQNNDIFIEAWRPIQQGSLAKKGIDITDRLYNSYQKTPAQIALNWLISQKNVTTITKISNRKYLEENLGAVSWKMSDEDIKLLMDDYPIQLDRSNIVQLK